MSKLSPEDFDTLERSLKICQTCVWAAAEHLEEYGDPTTAAAIIYSYEELRGFLEEQQEKCSKKQSLITF